ncbi:MAG: hypothetical protein WCK82_00475 [Bacteroidota bacterium]
MTDLTPIIKNFGHIKSVYNTLLAESVMSDDKSKKELFKGYVKSIKENEIIKTQFLVYTNIEQKVESDATKAAMFVKENIDLFSKFSKKDILEANTKLVGNLLFENDVVDNKELYENISTLIFTNKNPETIDTIVEATSKVVDYIVNNKTKTLTEAIELPNSMLSTMMVEKYNEKYASLDESEKKILKTLIDSTDVEKKEVYLSTIKECITLIDEKLDTADLNAKDKLLRVKDKLLNDKQEINEDFIKNISKLVELRSNLKEN